MTGSEIAMCAAALLSSSTAQIMMKAASGESSRNGKWALLGGGMLLQCSSVGWAVLVLQTLPLSKLMPFAAIAYVLVPIASCLLFKEALGPRFWGGAVLIAGGITLTFA